MPLAKVTEWADFFCTSTCRDLLFHVQEHRINLPEIGSFLSENQMRLLGFVLPRGVLETFRRRFPNGNTTDLALWHAFEIRRIHRPLWRCMNSGYKNSMVYRQ